MDREKLQKMLETATQLKTALEGHVAQIESRAQGMVAAHTQANEAAKALDDANRRSIENATQMFNWFGFPG